MLFSIIIPTFDNYEYLRLTLDSILKNSHYKHQIIIHINGNDNKSQLLVNDYKLQNSKSDTNIGLCSGVNKASKLAECDYILYAHDDMYFLPNWDKELYEEVQRLNTEKFYLSCTQIGPLKVNNTTPNHIYFHAGNDLKSFDEKKLLENYSNLTFYNLQGSHWAPHLIKRSLWEKIGGFSIEFDPGFGSDPDLNMKLWMEGVRIFKGINKSRIYHFGSKTTRQNKNVIKNNANKIFLLKWGISINYFTKYYLKRGEKFIDRLNDPKFSLVSLFDLFICKLKYFYFIVTK